MFYENEFERFFDDLLVSKQYGPTLTLLRGPDYRSRIIDRCSDAIQACLKHLTDENYETNFDLYCCCEEFLKYVASTASPEEVLLELLEIIETFRSDNVFTSALKALQICLQKQKRNRVNGLEWSLNSIQTYIVESKLPAILEADYDPSQEKLLEQNAEIYRMLMNYMTLSLFLEPLIESALRETNTEKNGIFRNRTRTHRNILACFVLQLLGKPLALLDLSNRLSDKSNTYSFQCAQALSSTLCQLLGDPFLLLPYAETKVRWKRRRRARSDDGVYESAPRDVFLLEEKTPLTAIAVFYYLLFSENILPENVPRIYHPVYVFEMALYLVNHLLSQDRAALQLKGIRLGSRLLENLTGYSIACDSLDLQIHPSFCSALSQLIGYSTAERNRKDGLQLLREYILHFDESGQFRLLQNLIRTIKHNGLIGYLIGMYKNLLAACINADELSNHFRSGEFKEFLLKTICNLPKDVETDLIEYSEQIMAALNVVRFLTIRDKKNRTGFWDFINIVEKKFLGQLRKAIDFSKAHYKVEKQQVIASNDEETMSMPKELEFSLQSGEQLPQITKEHKLKTLESALLVFDLIESLLARAEECIEAEKLNKT